MKKLIMILTVSLILGINLVSLAPAIEPSGETAQVTLTVDGMTCVTCVPRLKIGLDRTGAVKKVEVSIDEEIVVINYDPEKIDINGLITAVENAGFHASPQQPANDTARSGQ